MLVSESNAERNTWKNEVGGRATGIVWLDCMSSALGEPPLFLNHMASRHGRCGEVGYLQLVVSRILQQLICGQANLFRRYVARDVTHHHFSMKSVICNILC